MKSCGRLWKAIVLLLGCLGALPMFVPAREAVAALSVVPDRVEIGTFYRGCLVAVSAVIPAGAEAVVEVVGGADRQKLLRKGRRGGLWMSVGETEVSGAPSLYLVMSTNSELLSESSLDPPWGYRALAHEVRFTGSRSDAEQANLLREFIKLKESEKLFGVFPGVLTLSPAADGQYKVNGTFLLPSTVKPDTYKVLLNVVRAGTVVARSDTELTVAMVGFPALLWKLAWNHGVTYGIVAVVIALLTGFVMGYLFKKGAGGH
jgi:Putative transmembrane protein (Alph_Pro_TM)